MTNTTVLFSEDFPPELARGMEGAGGTVEGSSKPSLEDLEKNHILMILKETHFNKTKASEILGIDRATLYRKAQRYGIELRGKW